MLVKHTLLALLYQRPLHGYELRKQLNLAIKAEWVLTLGRSPAPLNRLKSQNNADQIREQLG
jgi:DNA-binding PadR family transcriptional regulator